MEKVKVVLFDCDGVLIQSMEDFFSAWERAFKDEDIELRREDFFPLEGMKLANVAKILSQKYQKSINVEEFLNRKDKYYLENHSFKFYSGVVELIDFLKDKGTLLAIISAGSRTRITKTMPQDFLKKFNVIISGDDTERGKPYPDPYLSAMEKLNVSTNASIVVENAPLGIKSAKSAGVYCIAITSTLDKSFLTEADEIIGNFSELRERINV